MTHIPYGVDDGFDEWYQKNYPTSTSEVLIATSRAYKAGYKVASDEFAVANDQIVNDLRAQNEITKALRNDIRTWKESYDECERQAREQIAKLESDLEDVAELKRLHDGCNEAMQLAIKNIKELETKLAAAEKDAARYRWLRDCENNGDFLGKKLINFEPGDVAMDATIDAAMREGRE